MRILIWATALLIVGGCNSSSQNRVDVGFGNAASAVQKPAETIMAPTDVCTWDNVDWEELSRAEQKAWETLGWKQQSCNADFPKGTAPSDSRAWVELTANERDAAQRLGFNQKSWDSDTCKNR